MTTQGRGSALQAGCACPSGWYKHADWDHCERAQESAVVAWEPGIAPDSVNLEWPPFQCAGGSCWSADGLMFTEGPRDSLNVSEVRWTCGPDTEPVFVEPVPGEVERVPTDYCRQRGSSGHFRRMPHALETPGVLRCGWGLFGTTCQFSSVACREARCSGRGACTGQLLGCSCDAGWTGPGCVLPTCGHRGRRAAGGCECEEGFGGPGCRPLPKMKTPAPAPAHQSRARDAVVGLLVAAAVWFLFRAHLAANLVKLGPYRSKLEPVPQNGRGAPAAGDLQPRDRFHGAWPDAERR